MNKRKAIIISSLLELGVVCIIGVFLYKKNNPTSTANLNSDTVEIKKSDSEYTYFYEPVPGSTGTFTTKPSWLLENAKYVINSDTLNEESDYAIEKEDSVFRILTLGDSLTFGLYLNTHDNYPEILERLLNSKLQCGVRYEVLNLGVAGYDVSYVIERFGVRGKKYNPDLLVWLVHHGNFTKNQEMISERLTTYKDNTGDASDRARKEILEELGEDGVTRTHEKKFNAFMSDFENNIVLFSPKGWMRDTPEELIQKALKNKNRYYFEMEKELGDNEIFPDHHPNKVGAEHIAGEVFEYLVKNELIACK